ncbi:MAG: methyltransferase domain-containing protein [Bacteroidetes bacterium]|nr:methyltransferase domain-containing protein [Bacteroidota bacterium]
MSIDDPFKNDNRNYNFLDYPDDYRQEFPVILGLISSDSKVIDLGCGNGTLLSCLKKEKHASVKGVELSASGVKICRKKKLDVIQGRIDEHLPFKDNSFDYAICNVTIQMVMYPEVLLSEMKRIARYQILSFPNFAFYRNRIQLLLKGKMPPHMLFNYKWYNTGHIHQLSLKDLKNLISDIDGLTIKQILSVDPDNGLKKILMHKFPNLFMHIPIVILEKKK